MKKQDLLVNLINCTISPHSSIIMTILPIIEKFRSDYYILSMIELSEKEIHHTK
jgi:hypothetical protein